MRTVRNSKVPFYDYITWFSEQWLYSINISIQ